MTNILYVSLVAVMNVLLISVAANVPLGRMM